MAEGFLSEQEVMARLGIAKADLDRLIEEGLLSVVDQEGQRAFSEEEVNALELAEPLEAVPVEEEVPFQDLGETVSDEAGPGGLFDFSEDLEWISERLHGSGSRAQVRDGLAKLENLGLIARDAEGRLRPEQFGQFDLPPLSLAGGRIRATALDNLSSAALILALLDRLAVSGRKAHVYGLFTVAEEAGFVGAMESIKSKLLPARVPLVVMETSRELPSFRQGA